MSQISNMELVGSKDRFSADERITINVKFSIVGQIRASFTEERWTQAYDKNDVAFKLKYGIKLQVGGFRKRTLGSQIVSYRKASIFWTRNPLLVNPMKERRVWVQVAKNFKPFIRLTEEEVREELFDFDEGISFQASELGSGRHTISAEVQASWQKHEFIPTQSCKNNSPEIELIIN